MSLDAVVAQVGAALGRGHALFSPAPADAGASLRASADTFDAVSRKMTDTSTQMLDTKGRFGAAYGDMAQRFSSRFATSGGQDRTIAGLASEAADADAAGRTQTGNVVNGAVNDTNRNAPYSNTVAGQNAILTDLRDRVDQQRKVIAAYKNLVGQLAARARAQGGRGARGMGAGSGLGQMFSGLGGGQGRGGGSGGGGLGSFSPASLTGLLKPALDTNSGSGGVSGVSAGGLHPGVANEKGLQRKTILAARAISAEFPEIRQIGGVRADALKWHPQGLALDVMIPQPYSAEGQALGQRVLQFVLRNAQRFGLDHAIYRQTMYIPGRGPSAMENRGSPTANHMDHVHLATSGGGYPSPGESFD
ncbi:hypothetical protein [Mycobacteroides abscessus]|uniref:hypothetical protein n=1 Tax=Mycobacteroides abscessus TaxID=36809 RepID=UPI0009A6CBCB|nr:hypothetical protein [Mycobacteroides abscessus]